MKKIFYEKRGRKYVPVFEYSNELMDSFPEGNHLIMCYPGGKSQRFNIDPNYAAIIAAGRVAENAISMEIMRATEIRHRENQERQLTPGQRTAWDNLIKEFGDSAKQLEWPSAREAAKQAVEVMEAEAMRLMENDSVRTAYEHFQLLCDLSKTHKSS